MTNEDLTLGPDAAYQFHLANGEFRIQQCDGCERRIFYPRILCPHCGDTQLSWHKVSGNGTVYACSVVMGKPGTDTDYAVVLVDLEEGVRMMSRVIDCDQHAVKIGMRLTARIAEKDGKPLVVFAPASRGAQ